MEIKYDLFRDTLVKSPDTFPTDFHVFSLLKLALALQLALATGMTHIKKKYTITEKVIVKNQGYPLKLKFYKKYSIYVAMQNVNRCKKVRKSTAMKKTKLLEGKLVKCRDSSLLRILCGSVVCLMSIFKLVKCRQFSFENPVCGQSYINLMYSPGYS